MVSLTESDSFLRKDETMLHVIVPILVGGVIGYFTNYIAIKMLFRPRKEIYLGKWKLPFTPGVIPKNQKRIANAVGNAVSDQLITKDDLLKQMNKSGMKDKLVRSIVDKILHIEVNLSEPSDSMNKLTDKISDGVVEEIKNTDFVPVIREIGNQALSGYLQNPMIAMLLNPSMLDGIYGKISDNIKEYAENNGKQVVENYIHRKIGEIQKVSVKDLFTYTDIESTVITEKVSQIVDEFMTDKGMELLNTVDIKGIVSEKIETMKVEELEALVMYVMENELKAVVNLGAVLGALIGIVNVFF